MKAHNIILALVPWICCQANALITKHCNVAAEPTFGEIFNLVLPVSVPSIDMSTSSGGNIDSVLLRAGGGTLRYIFKGLFNMKFPLGYLLSDGAFEIELSSSQTATFANYDTVLLKNKPLIQQAGTLFV